MFRVAAAIRQADEGCVARLNCFVPSRSLTVSPHAPRAHHCPLLFVFFLPRTHTRTVLRLFLLLGAFLFCTVFIWLLFSPRLPACESDIQPETYDWSSSIKLIRIMIGFMFALILGMSGIGFVGYGLLRETNAENRSMRGTGRAVMVCRLCVRCLRPKLAA